MQELESRHKGYKIHTDLRYSDKIHTRTYWADR